MILSFSALRSLFSRIVAVIVHSIQNSHDSLRVPAWNNSLYKVCLLYSGITQYETFRKSVNNVRYLVILLLMLIDNIFDCFRGSYWCWRGDFCGGWTCGQRGWNFFSRRGCRCSFGLEQNRMQKLVHFHQQGCWLG